jgi:hypothetical protein
VGGWVGDGGGEFGAQGAEGGGLGEEVEEADGEGPGCG